MPETYVFRRGLTRQKMLDDMQAAQAKMLDELWKARAVSDTVKTKEQAVTLASIVEKETAIPEERPLIASVFHNRLKQGMRLQSDPTIIYGLVGGKGKLDRGLTKDDVASDTAYNTYRIDGLPPGPIANPGRASLEAVLNPPDTGYLYFVADGSGGHAFAKTLEEHNANVAKWRAIESTRQRSRRRWPQPRRCKVACRFRPRHPLPPSQQHLRTLRRQLTLRRQTLLPQRKPFNLRHHNAGSKAGQIGRLGAGARNLADGCQSACAHSKAKAQAVRALIRPVGHLLPCQGAREKAITVKRSLLPSEGWEKRLCSRVKRFLVTMVLLSLRITLRIVRSFLATAKVRHDSLVFRH